MRAAGRPGWGAAQPLLWPKEPSCFEGSNEALYTTVADVTKAVEALGLGEKGRYISALTFGNVHGVWRRRSGSRSRKWWCRC